jgi:hypothetical protein
MSILEQSDFYGTRVADMADFLNACSVENPDAAVDTPVYTKIQERILEFVNVLEAAGYIAQNEHDRYSHIDDVRMVPLHAGVRRNLYRLILKFHREMCEQYNAFVPVRTDAIYSELLPNHPGIS